MTTEKDAFEGDDLVTETYRELGVEKAPEHLNQRILAMAPQDGKQSPERGILFAVWMKPVAWAATIGLSLAIVLELSQVPTVVVPSDKAPAAELLREEAELQDTDLLKKTENRARLQSGPNRQLISKDELGRSAARVDDVEILSRESKGKIDAAAAAPEMVSDLFMLEQKEFDIADSCDTAVRLSAEGWLECIENLRQSGHEAAADREYEAFILEYSVESRDLEGNK